MSLKRKWFEFRRLLRHQTVVFIFFAVSLFGFIFFVASVGDSPREREHEHLNHEKLRLPGNRESVILDVNDVQLPGDTDPNTVFTDGVLGNYEPQTSEGHWRAGCKYWKYPEDLPKASVVIAFHNEGWSPLMRTVHSVLLRSPPQLLEEVILVDDFSDKPHLKEKLDEYVKKFNGKVKIVRNKDREGLIRTRTNGAVAAKGEVVIFLDAHCEVNINWLPPLLSPIKHNRKVMTVPVIDGIDMNNWEYRRVYGDADRHFRGIFEWGLLYKETEIPVEEKKRRKKHSEPFRSPTHAGGLFAIDKKWFEEIGYYDPGLQIWGGEQYELSFKIWQCGGGILFVPCSHVGHVYRNHMPYNFGKLTGKPVISTNLIRVIKTWMDEYGDYYYIREPQAKFREPGDISEQLALRKKLNCKPFKWYMQYVAYDVFKSYPLLPENDVWGEAKNPVSGKCIDTMGQPVPGSVGATPCHGWGGNQLIKLNMEGQMTQGEWCITPVYKKLRTGHCKKGAADGPFKYNRATNQVENVDENTCLTVDKDSNSHELKLDPCDADDPYQKWEWKEKYN